ncbi:hypothetical protein BJX70DRAFT_296025 [Aspergillus crustosus]
MDERSRHERLSTSSGGLSGRIRRRFSRDARDIYRQPKRSDRPAKIPFLHFPSKQPPASYDLGSSLMSERGYDSDAQYIATPKNPAYTTEHLASKSRNGLALSPRRVPPPREPNKETTEETTFGITLDNRGLANEQPVYHPERGGSQASWRSREHEPSLAQTAKEHTSSPLDVTLGGLRSKPSSPRPSGPRSRAQERPAPLPLRIQEMHRQHIPAIPMRPTTPKGTGFEDGISQRSGHRHDTGGLTYPSHHEPQQQAYTTSTESLGGCPPPISVRKRHQRPRRDLVLDDRSVYLGEMNISRLLASSGSTSHIVPQNDPYENTQSSSNAGTWSSKRRQAPNNPTTMPPLWDTPEASLVMQSDAISKLHSPEIKVSSIDQDADELDFSRNPSGNIPSTRRCLPLQTKDAQSLNIEHTAASAATDPQAMRSKFTEKFGSDQSAGPAGLSSLEDDDLGSPRKISIGWMSEGRRIGYGYTLVPPETAVGERAQDHRGPKLENCGSIGKSPKGSLAGSVTEHTSRQRSPLSEESNQGPTKASESSFDVSAILQKINLPRWPGANFTLRTSNNSEAGSCDSGSSSLLNILASRKKAHANTDLPSDAENPWEFCSWVRPVQSSNAQQVPQQDSMGFHEHTEAQLIEKLTTLRRRGGAWATKRKVSELARNFEKRADRAVARLAASTEQFPVVQRTATRVLRLRPGGKGRPGDLHDSDPIFSVNQFDGSHDDQPPGVRPSERISSGISGDWDSLYEECLEERSIPE